MDIFSFRKCSSADVFLLAFLLELFFSEMKACSLELEAGRTSISVLCPLDNLITFNFFCMQQMYIERCMSSKARVYE